MNLANSADAESLDPTDWDTFRALGQRVMNDMVSYVKGFRSRDVWTPVPADCALLETSEPPAHGQSIEGVYDEIRRDVLPHPFGNIHPRFWGWVIGSGSPSGMLAELVIAAMNSHVGIGRQAPIAMEQQVLRWLRTLVSLPIDGGGTLVSGCTMANVAGIQLARDFMSDHDVGEEGIGTSRHVVYGSSQTHSSIRRALEMLGMGRRAFRSIEVDDAYCIRIPELLSAIADDRARGLEPLCVVANAGTTNTGAFDDLEAIAAVCTRESLWMHVDGAFGATTAFSPELRHRLQGIEHADTVAFDLHKWLHVPHDVGVLLTRDARHQASSYPLGGSYLSEFPSEFAAGAPNLMACGPQMSRSFRALKVWMQIKEHGTDKLGRMVEKNVAQARHLALRIEQEEDLELLAPVPLCIVCFRYRTKDRARSDSVNQAILRAVQESGFAVPSHTVLQDRFAIRVCIANHRTQTADLDTLVEHILALGRKHDV